MPLAGLQDRVVIVTGAASGIGLATAGRLAREGVFLNLRQMLRVAVEQGGGASIVNTSSGTALHDPGLSAYAATKAAILSLTRSAAVEYSKQRIRVNALVPGPVGTPLFEAFPEDFQAGAESFNPQGRRGTPDEVAAVVAFLLSDEAS